MQTLCPLVARPAITLVPTQRHDRKALGGGREKLRQELVFGSNTWGMGSIVCTDSDVQQGLWKYKDNLGPGIQDTAVRN